MKIQLEVNPWQTPNFVSIKAPPKTRQEGFFDSGNSVALKDVDENLLSELCDTFRAEIFKKAGKNDPKIK